MLAPTTKTLTPKLLGLAFAHAQYPSESQAHALWRGKPVISVHHDCELSDEDEMHSGVEVYTVLEEERDGVACGL